jgi:hypothetical protein
MDEVHVQMEAESSCQKLCRRETNVNGELAADCTGHVDGVSAARLSWSAVNNSSAGIQVTFAGLMMDLRAAQALN